MWTWIKSFALKQAIGEMVQLEPIFAARIREAQTKLGAIPPEEFAKVLVEEIQTKLCVIAGLDPKDVIK